MRYVTRFVVTHVGRDGMRTLAFPAQGRFTYATAEEAQRQIDAMKENNSPERLAELFGPPLEARECQCWPEHFDPVGVYFE